jgi:hypothetical protein
MLAQLFALLALLAITSASPINKRDGTQIRAGRDGQCLSLDGLPGVLRYGGLQNGTPVITRDCLGANTWFINRGSGSITVPGTNFALDIGLNPGNNGALKVSLAVSTSLFQLTPSGMGVLPRLSSADLVPHRRQPYRADWR